MCAVRWCRSLLLALICFSGGVHHADHGLPASSDAYYEAVADVLAGVRATSVHTHHADVNMSHAAYATSVDLHHADHGMSSRSPVES